MDGFVVVDKPEGMSSFAVVREARKKLNTRKIGHLGTLDPAATGVLVLAIGQGTKLVEFLMKADKKYIAKIRLGAESNTYDREGEIVENPSAKEASLEQIEKKLKGFVGKTMQMPPKYSALKVKGQRACDIVRRGGDVELKPRKIIIHSIEVKKYEWPELEIEVNCGSGTYIRSLAHDLGSKLGTGAYLLGLVRTSLGRFALEGAANLEELNQKHLRPLHEMIEEWPRWDLPAFVYGRLKNGLSVETPKKMKQEYEESKYPLIAAFVDGEFKGVLEWAGGGRKLKFKKQIV